MKPTVVISKVGSTFYTREEAAKNSKSGEQGETEGIVKHLLARGDLRVVYFGQWRGEVFNGLTYVESCIDGMNEKTSGAEQESGWAVDVKNLAPYEPKLFVDVAGYASTLSWIGNPKNVRVQAAGVRYVAPSLNVIQRLKLPRIVVNNDPRNYPRNGEMSLGWDWTVPCALLSQRASEFSKQVAGKTYRVREVYAAAENWCEFVHRNPTDEVPCTLLAHAHISDGCRELGRDVAFGHLLSPQADVDELKRRGMRVYGLGWKSFCNYDPELMLGAVTPDEVMNVLARAKTCPAVAAGNYFYTGKLRTCLAQRCLPLFYGRGEPYTFDPLAKYFSMGVPQSRVHKPGDLLKAVDYWEAHDSLRQKVIRHLWDVSAPDFTSLDRCVDDVIRGRNARDDSWWEDYGGYRCE